MFEANRKQGKQTPETQIQLKNKLEKLHIIINQNYIEIQQLLKLKWNVGLENMPMKANE